MHHITTDALRCAFYDLKRTASAGVDGLVWKEYEDGLDERLLDLHGRVHSGAYRALPSRRVEIPKPDGGTRPLGIAALEDKIVQKAVVDVILTPIYEPAFLGFSYGFRPGRGAHDALDALAFGIERRKVSWIIDADIRAFFDRLSRDHLLRFLEHRIGDKRVLRLITKWLNAGVMEGVVGLLKPRFSGRESTGLIDEVGAWSFCCVTTARALAVSLLLTELGLSSAIAVAFEKQDLGMVGQAVDQSDGARGVGEDGVPAFEG